MTQPVATSGSPPTLILMFLYRRRRWTSLIRRVGVCKERVRPVVSFVHNKGPALKRFPCSSCRANVVIGDITERGALYVVDSINKLPPGSGRACFKRCDVARWDDQVDLFDFAMAKFGAVDIVVSVLRLFPGGLLLDPHTLSTHVRLPVRESGRARTLRRYRWEIMEDPSSRCRT